MFVFLQSSHTHPNKQRALETFLSNHQSHGLSQILVVIGPPSAGKSFTIRHYLTAIYRRFATFKDDISNSKQAFIEFLEETAHERVIFVDGCPFFGVKDFVLVLNELAESFMQKKGKLVVTKV